MNFPITIYRLPALLVSLPSISAKMTYKAQRMYTIIYNIFQDNLSQMSVKEINKTNITSPLTKQDKTQTNTALK